MTNSTAPGAGPHHLELVLIGDEAGSERLVRAALQAQSLALARVSSVDGALHHLTDHDPACVLLALGASVRVELEAVVMLCAAAPRPALVVLSEHDDPEHALAVIRAGAEDCVPVAHASVGVLDRVIRYSVERRQAQERLIESRELQEAAFRGSPIGMALQTLDGRYLRVNPALTEMLGLEPDTLLGSSFLDLIHPDDRTESERGLEALAAGRSLTFQTLKRYARGDGEWLSMLTNVALIRNARGQPMSLFVQMQDITERVDAELASGRLAAIVESSGDAITATTLDGVITAWNPGAEVLYGYAAAEAVGRHASLIIPPEEMSQAALTLGETRAGRAVGPFESRRCRSDGTVIDVSVTASPIRDERGAVVGTSVIARDISAEKVAQARLEEREQYFRAVFDSSQDAIFIADSKRRYVDANPAACALTGYSVPELRAMRIEDLAPDEDVMLVRGSWPTFLQVGVSAGSFRLRRRDGTVRVVDFASSAHIVPNRHLSVKRDVTDRLQAEEAHHQLEAQLQQARRLESVGQLAGGIAHDFNNLLSVILNYSHFVAGRVQGDEGLLADVREMTAAAERAAALTRQLLVISRREAIHPELVDLGDVVRDAQRLLSRTLGEHIEVIAETDAGPSVVWADRGQLDQVLMNLAVNARDAMPEGGELRLSVAREEREQPGGVRLTVADTGAGMSEEVRAHAFEPFFTTKPKGSGTGLGLATVYGIVAQAGGTVALHSHPGQGTVVQVTLPRRSAAVNPEPPAPRPQPPPGGGLRVMVVEDEREVRELTRRILAEHGYDVVTAANGDEALRACREDDVDLVLTDVVMPGISGPELAERLRAVRAGLRVVYMSGYSDRGRELAEREQLLEKPFTAPGLLAFVAEQVARSTPRVGHGHP